MERFVNCDQYIFKVIDFVVKIKVTLLIISLIQISLSCDLSNIFVFYYIMEIEDSIISSVFWIRPKLMQLY